MTDKINATIVKHKPDDRFIDTKYEIVNDITATMDILNNTSFK